MMPRPHTAARHRVDGRAVVLSREMRDDDDGEDDEDDEDDEDEDDRARRRGACDTVDVGCGDTIDVVVDDALGTTFGV